MIDTTLVPERAVLIGVIYNRRAEKEIAEYLDELAFLTETAGAIPVKKFTQYIEHPNPRTLIGSGKLNEIKNYIRDNAADIVIFDDDLSPSQLRNIEKIVERRVLDRTNLILDIFATRAKTAHAKTQVELAQYQYLLPRLAHLWTHLERQRGGIGLRGPGEAEIETDRRIIHKKIAHLKEELKKIDTQKATQRQNRGKLVRVALVGYTNVGKSTIMNLLSKSDIFAENKLFATLDTTVRKVILNNLPFLLCDTVGFIRKLPHHLVESFKSTLDEVREADILLHIVDISHPCFEDQIIIVNQTLQQLNASDKPTVMVFNKIDAYISSDPQGHVTEDYRRCNGTSSNKGDLAGQLSEYGGLAGKATLEDLKNSWVSKNNEPCIFISAIYKDNFPEFKELLYKYVREIHIKRYPYNDFLYYT
ncbi:MAG: GTPase HflX [Bacteroidia bacterium]|nr:GTPase HflX [Bacteroidia bacterium]